jgi:hypothetical protein
MKKVSIFLLVTVMAIGISTAAIAAPVLTFDIDFYGGGYDKGVYDTGTTIDLELGQSVMADIYVSGLNETGNGLAGWGALLEFGPYLDAVSVAGNATLWPISLLTPVIEDDYLTIERFPMFGAGVEGDDLLLFTVELQCTGLGLSELILWDMDKGGASVNWVTLLANELDNQFPVTLASINNVPIPGSLLLLGSGLLGLIGIRRRAKS